MPEPETTQDPSSPPPPSPETAPTPEPEATVPPSPAPAATDDAAPRQNHAVRPAGPEAPRGWSTLRLAIAPDGQRFRILAKNWHEDLTEDPEVVVRNWCASAARDANALATRISELQQPKDGLLVFNVQLLRGGESLCRVEGHTMLHAFFTETGVFDAPTGMAAAVERDLTHPFIEAVQEKLQELFPQAVRRALRAPPEALQAAQPEPGASDGFPALPPPGT